MTEEEWMADYIVNFLLPLPGWFCMGDSITYYEIGTDSDLLKNGLTIHCWKMELSLHKKVFTKMIEKNTKAIE